MDMSLFTLHWNHLQLRYQTFLASAMRRCSKALLPIFGNILEGGLMRYIHSLQNRLHRSLFSITERGCGWEGNFQFPTSLYWSDTSINSHCPHGLHLNVDPQARRYLTGRLTIPIPFLLVA